MVILLFISPLFTGIYRNHQNTIEKEFKSRVQAFFSILVMTRKWNARYGGVFVEKTPGMESNPYLENPDITADNGKTYTRKNPTPMTGRSRKSPKKKALSSFTSPTSSRSTPAMPRTPLNGKRS